MIFQPGRRAGMGRGGKRNMKNTSPLLCPSAEFVFDERLVSYFRVAMAGYGQDLL